MLCSRGPGVAGLAACNSSSRFLGRGTCALHTAVVAGASWGLAGFVPGDLLHWDVGSLAKVVALWMAAATSFEWPPLPARALNLGLALPLQEHHPQNLNFEGHQ